MPVDVPRQIGDAPPRTAPSEDGLTVTVAVFVATAAQVPFCTMASYCQIPTAFGISAYVLAVTASSAHATSVVSFSCHLTTVPLFPVKVKVLIEAPRLIALCVAGAIVPAIVAASTVTVVALELATEQLPLWTTALNWVVAVKLPEV